MNLPKDFNLEDVLTWLRNHEDRKGGLYPKLVLFSDQSGSLMQGEEELFEFHNLAELKQKIDKPGVGI